MSYKKYISSFITLLAVILFAAYFINNRQDFMLLREINVGYFVLVIMAHFSIIFFNGLLIKWIVEPFRISLGVYECYYISLYSSIGNFFLPIGSGMAMRAIYLKRRVGLNYKNFMTTLYGNYMIVFLCNGVLGVCALVALRNIEQPEGVFMTLLVIFAAMSITTLLLVLHIIPSRALAQLGKSIGRIGKAFVSVINGWEVVAKRRDLIVKMCAITLLGFIALMAVNYFAISALGLKVGFWALVLYSAIGSIALLLNITPGSIGIKEGLYVFSAGALGFSVPQILSIAIIDRVSKFIVLVVGWVLTYTRTLPNSKEFRDVMATGRVQYKPKSKE